MARLAPTRDDHWMNLQGDRLRRAIDRNKRMIPKLLEAFGLTATGSSTHDEEPAISEKKDSLDQSQEPPYNQSDTSKQESAQSHDVL